MKAVKLITCNDGSMSAMPVEESLKSRLQNFIRLKYDP